MASIPVDQDNYLEQRVSLINADRELRRDWSNLQTRSVLEKEADEIVRSIRAEEAASVWKEEHPDIPHPFPGMEFLTGKKIIEKTRIFEILSQMPKGTLLHAHIGAMVDTRILLDLALQQPAIHVRVAEVLTIANIKSIVPEFLPLPMGSYNLTGPGITASDYIPNTWVHIARARELFDASFGGSEGFDEWVINAMTLRPDEAYGTYNTALKIWEKFESTFSVSCVLVHFLPIFKQYLRLFLLSSVDDGIFYMEPRIDFFVADCMRGADGELNVTHRDIVLLFGEAIREVKEELEKDGRGDKFLGARIIYTTVKVVAPKDLYRYLDDCIALKKEFPHLIAGYDLVGHENVLHPLIDYIEPFLYFRKRQVEEGIEIPFLFHAGETLGDGDATDSNVYDAILLCTKRIGHGFSLVKHPKLMQLCRERGILLEVCPISNEVLRLTSSMSMHPLPILLNNGVPVALSSDGPSVFGNMGLTYDFFQVLVASEVSGLSTLGVLARDSIEFSMMTVEEKKRALLVWEEEWRIFLEQIVTRYKE
ncbi:Metallo-dependent hydrolase [Macrolepiota fuliginosa MF-IS2]|uniref:adenosine deaminase n=1 Tax=Macrolepiota fuliginosa MF-IS2 TaxID=1400762 RepID=A0A9P5X991_9AGAR|nr:Metallo-dependent hydrolase [Macrolepiota fuliginosa MF-IS2]